LSYPYSGRDLFAEPESYAYAACAAEDYIGAWKQNRNLSISNLAARMHEEPIPPDAVYSQQPMNTTALSTLLERATTAAALDPFVIKFEVFRRLFAWYCDDGRRHPDAPTADLGTYILFAECLCELAEKRSSLKHLSTLLKLCDALASQASNSFQPQDAIRLIDVLKRECALVDRMLQAA
jgi:hypothetical protein